MVEHGWNMGVTCMEHVWNMGGKYILLGEAWAPRSRQGACLLLGKRICLVLIFHLEGLEGLEGLEELE